ncbi:MAG: MarR family transcriptional regulator [Steroidobacteraceae bacterium]
MASNLALDLREKLHGAPHSKRSLRLWLRLLSCAIVIEKRIRNKLRDEFDTTLPRFDVLAALERNDKGLTMSQLSRQILVSNGNVTGVVARLIDDCMVERIEDTSDRRVVKVTMTRKGRDSFSRMARVHERWIDQIFGDLGDDEINALLDDLARLRKSVDNNPV